MTPIRANTFILLTLSRDGAVSYQLLAVGCKVGTARHNTESGRAGEEKSKEPQTLVCAKMRSVRALHCMKTRAG